MQSELPWTDYEPEFLREQILQAIPNGLYDEEPAMLWTRVVQRQVKRVYYRRFRGLRNFYHSRTPDSCRQHYLTRLRPLFLTPARTSLEERPWSHEERETLREYISTVLPGGLLEGQPLSWPEVAEKMVEDSHVAWTPFRLYDEDNVREQYLKDIQPRFVNSNECELALKSTTQPWVPPPLIVLPRSVAGTKINTEAIVPASPVSNTHLDTEADILVSSAKSIKLHMKDTSAATEASGPPSSTMTISGPGGRTLMI